MRFLSTLFLSIALPALAQPEVHSDRRVTFRIEAPRATGVSFFGDWMPVGKPAPMMKDAKGVWSVTLGPLAPGDYIYTYTVDGVTIPDPVHPRVKLRARTVASMVEVPAPTPAVWEPRDVPHGSVDVNWQKSSVLGDTRWVWIYTPPGYEKSKAKYPVLYLFHGSNDTAGGWVLAGHANFILDNLIAEKKAAPMIVVMPFGHAVPFGSPREVQATNVAKYEEYILKDVMPMVNGKYRVETSRAKTAIAGLSMGGGQSLSIGFKHVDKFSAIGAFSAAAPAELPLEGAIAKKPLIWFACGKDDTLVKRNEDLAALLKSKGIAHTYQTTEGNHTYAVWRRYLAEFAPLLFR